MEGGGAGIGEFVRLARLNDEAVVGREVVGGSLDGKPREPGFHDENFPHVVMGVDRAGDTGGDRGAGQLGQGWDLSIVEPYTLNGRWVVAHRGVNEGISLAQDHGSVGRWLRSG